MSDNLNPDLIQFLTGICKEISTQTDSLLESVDVFFTVENGERFPDTIQYLENVKKSALLFKEELNKLIVSVNENKLQTFHLSEQLSKIRHDLRNPINALQGYAEISLEEFAVAKAENLVNQVREILNKTQQILHLVDQIKVVSSSSSSPSLNISLENDADKGIPSSEEYLGAEYQEFKKRISILIVDDIEENCTILALYLNHIGYKNTYIAHNGAEALNLVNKNDFDLVLLDVDMPNMSGIEVLLHLKEHIVQKHMKVLMVSGADTMENTLQCIKLGAEDFLTKPFNRELLKVRIGSCIEKRWFSNKEIIYRQQLESEKQRYEKLLYSVFPPTIVKELVATNKVEARHYQNVAVLFTDVVNFTQYCDSHKLAEVIRNVQDLSEMCEEIAIKHNLQKIKTIGDGFLAIAGMMTVNENPVLDCIRCAEDLLKESVKLDAKWQLRAGVAYGTVIGGVVGRRQYLFDIWGDTVNMAARIQSYTEPNTILLTEPAWKQIQKQSEAESLGLITLKGKAPTEVFKYKGEK